MQHYIMYEDANWKLERWGKGLFYCLTSKDDNMSYFCQGDDADEFETELGNIEDNDDGYTYADVCSDLWEVYEAGATSVEA